MRLSTLFRKAWRSAGLAVMICCVLVSGTCAQSDPAAPPAKPDLSITELLSGTTNLPELIRFNLDVSSAEEWRKLVSTERDRLLTNLTENGYLDATVEIKTLADPEAPSPGSVEVRVEPGRQYKIAAVQITGTADPDLLHQLQDVGATVLNKVASTTIGEQLTDRMVWNLGQSGYAFASADIAGFRPIADSSEVDVDVVVKPGGLAHFSHADLTKVDRGARDWVSKMMPFKPGDVFSIDALAAFRQHLMNSDGVERARAEVVSAEKGKFALTIRYNKKYQPPPGSPEVGFGAMVLVATLLLIGWRQVVIAGRSTKTGIHFSDVAVFMLVIASVAVAGQRVLSFLQV